MITKYNSIGENKISSIAIARGIGILLVVLGHCLADGYAKRLIYLFHMPFFFFISGYLFKDEATENVLKYIVKKIKGLYLPFVACNLFSLLFHQVFCEIGIYAPDAKFISLSSFLKYVIKIFLCIKMEDVVAPLWFLPILMFASIGFCLMRWSELRLKSPKLVRDVMILGMFLMVYLIPERTGLKRAFILVALALMFFNCGYWVRRSAEKAITCKKKSIIAVICVMSLVIGAFYVDINIIQMRLSNPLFLMLFGMCGSYLVMYLAELIDRYSVPLLSYCGDHSLTILAWHYYAFIVVTLLQKAICDKTIIDINGFVAYPVIENGLFKVLWVFIYLGAGVCVPLLFEYLVKECMIKRWRKSNE